MNTNLPHPVRLNCCVEERSLENVTAQFDISIIYAAGELLRRSECDRTFGASPGTVIVARLPPPPPPALRGEGTGRAGQLWRHTLAFLGRALFL